LEVRELRPLQEQTQDKPLEALEAECSLYTEWRDEMSHRIQETKDCIPHLLRAKQTLLTDLHQKRKACRIDHTCFLDGTMSAKIPARELVFAPHLDEILSKPHPASPMNAEKGSARIHTDGWRANTKATIANAAKLCRHTMMLRRESIKMLGTAEKECKAATVRSIAAINQHVGELSTAKKNLNKELMETEKKLQVANKSVDKLEKKLRNSEVNLQTLNRQFESRQQRSEREHIRDHVHEKLELHLDACRMTVDHLRAHLDATKSIRNEMQTTAGNLREALKHKSAAYRVEMQCLRVVAHGYSAAEFNTVATLLGRPKAKRVNSMKELHRDVIDDYDNQGNLLRSRTGMELHPVGSDSDLLASPTQKSGVVRMTSA